MTEQKSIVVATENEKKKLRAFDVRILELAKAAPTVANAEASAALDRCVIQLGIASKHLQDYARETK